MTGTGAGTSSYGDLLLTSLLVLGLVCIVAFVAVRLVGRFLTTGRSRGAHLLDVVARLPLEPRRALYVVDVAGKTLLVGTSEMGLSVLSELDGAEVRARVAARPAFGDLVRAAWQRRFSRGAHDTTSPSRAATPGTSHDPKAAAAAPGPSHDSGAVSTPGTSHDPGAAPTPDTSHDSEAT